MLDIKEYLKQTKTVLLTQDAFDELMQRASAPVEIARNIVHEAINNSVWSDAVDTAEMHKVVDDKYAEMTEDKE